LNKEQLITDPETLTPDPAYFLKLTQSRMPFGKYKNCRLMDLPERYLIWLARKGYPKGLLGVMLRDVYEIKLNGLERLVSDKEF
jgi:uncharacterized protein (DUF3820 family)